ncbi:linear amide C-N hydrolase [Nocardia sp. No.11]|uniref:linear amide C-N hydrolase n=1 Tax=Nocardia sp. No.11 TaxID=3128861 RepID=UPI00319DCCF3
MCTSFTVTAEDGSVTAGRTMEFAFDLESRMIVFPRGMSYQAKSPDWSPNTSTVTSSSTTIRCRS